MKGKITLLVVLVLGLLLASCAEDSTPKNPIGPNSSVVELATTEATSAGFKELVCHYDKGMDIYFPIEVSTNSVAKHQSHGDWIVTAEVCGDELDNDCNGVIDDGCNACGSVDTDSDGVFDLCDNCPADYNPGQEDGNGNGVGDVCDVGQGVGTLTVTLEWDNVNDMDLWVQEPNGEVIAWFSPGPSSTGGSLDFDSNIGCVDQEELENITWPDGSSPDTGDYIVTVDEFADCAGDSNWTVAVRVNGTIKRVVNGSGPGGFTFSLDSDGTVTQLTPVTTPRQSSPRRTKP